MIIAVFFVSLAVSGQTTLKHSYDFEDGTANDGTGTAHAILQGDAAIADGAVTLSGTGFVSLPGKEIDVPSYGSITVEAVFSQAEGLTGDFTVLYGFGQTNPDVDWMGINYFIYQPTRSDNENSRFSISCLNTSDPWATETGINAAEIDNSNKHYVVTVLTATEMKLYQDGVLLGTETLTGDNFLYNVSNDTAFIGRSPYPDDRLWEGTVDELNIYEGELDEAAILQRTEDILGAAFIDASLASLSTNPGTLNPVFDPGTDLYEIYVPYGTTSVEIDAIPTVSGAEVAIYDGLGNLYEDGVVTFGEDGVDIEIIVTSLSGVTSQSFFISVFIDPATESARLSDIQLSAGSFIAEFHPDTTEYTALVPSGTTTVDVTGIPMWEGATVTGGGTVTLADGMGSTTITVTSEDGTNTREYRVDLYETIITTGVDYYIVNEASGFVVTESGEAYNLIRLQWPTKDNPAQLYHLEASGVEGQYFLKNQLGNYLTLVQEPVWDMIMDPALPAKLDSARFVIYEFEPGRFRIQSVARMNTPNYDMGPNDPPTIGGGIYSDKYPDYDLATWNIMLPEDVVDPYDTYLDTLFIDGVNLNPGFEFYNKEYYIIVPEGTTSLNIGATPNDPTATVTGAGTVNISGDQGSVTVTVTATDENYSTDYVIYYQVEPPLTLMHSYTFADGTVQDQEGDLDGIANGGSVVNGSFISDTEGDYISFSGTDLALYEYPSITLEAYVTTGENTGWTMLAYFGGTFGDYSYWMSIARNDDISKTSVDLEGSAEIGATGLEPGVGENHHYVSVLSYDTIFWYIDGELSGKEALPSNYLINDISTYGAWLCYGGYNDPTWFGSVHEFNIYQGQMDPQTVAARAVNFPVEDETSNGSLSDIMVDGVTIDGFFPLTLDYEVTYEAGTTDVPVVTVSTSNPNASAEVTAASELPGTTTIEVTAEDGTTIVTYTVTFTEEISDIATLSDLTVDGTTIDGFDPEVTSYDVILPAGTTTVPVVAATPTNSNASIAVNDAVSLPGTTEVVVTAQDDVTTITYYINFKLDLSSDATLSDLTVDGTTISGFASDVVAYTMTLPAGTTVIPTVVGVPTDTNATVVVTPAASLPGTTAIVVTAQDGEATKTYTIYFDLGTSVETQTDAGIKLYPTISDGDFRVITPGGISFITVHDITGKMVLKQTGESYEQSFRLQHAGIYFVKVECNGVCKNFKVIKTD